MDISLSVVGSLVLLVDDGVLGGSGTARKACVVVLGDLLVGLLGCLSTSSLNSLGDVVCGILEGKILVGVQGSDEMVKVRLRSLKLESHV